MGLQNLFTSHRVVRLLSALLVVHLLAHGLHGIPHAAIPVVLEPALTMSVILFMFLLPIAGVVVARRGAVRLGVAMFSIAMAGSLLLASVLHFAVPNPDHVMSVSAGPWQLPFQLTAILLVIPDAIGTVIGATLWRGLDGTRGEDLPQTSRIEGVPNAGFRPVTRLTYWVTKRWFGEVPEPLTVTAHHGKIIVGLNAFETALLSADRVDEGLKELAVLKAAMVVGCEFCIDIGSVRATELGISDAELRGLRDFETSEVFSERDRLVLRYAAAMTATPADVPDELFEALAEEFDEAALVELTATIAFENYRARYNQAFGIDAQGFAEESFCLRPDAVSDTTAPGDRAVSGQSP